MYEKFLERLREICVREHHLYAEVHEEYLYENGVLQGGSRYNESALEAIARHMVEVLQENEK